jgi:hypothetical protein
MSRDSAAWRVGETVELTLHYDGPLPGSAADGHVQTKNRLRAAFHPQLESFCATDIHFYNIRDLAKLPVARRWVNCEASELDGDVHGFLRIPLGGVDFTPVVAGGIHGHFAHLEIDLYRRLAPSRILNPQGDLDNRLKVLFDALRVPQDTNEMKGLELQPGTTRCYCLLENDSFITKLVVNSHQFHLPGDKDYVRLAIQVRISQDQN